MIELICFMNNTHFQLKIHIKLSVLTENEHFSFYEMLKSILIFILLVHAQTLHLLLFYEQCHVDGEVEHRWSKFSAVCHQY